MLKKISRSLSLIICTILIFAVSSFLLKAAKINFAPGLSIIKILVNNTQLGSDELADIVLSSMDTVSFEYRLDEESKNTNDAYMYRVVLRNAGDSSVRTIGLSNSTYASLTEGTYQFTVSAFDTKGKWNTAPEMIKFRVNSKESELIKINKKLTLQNSSSDSTITILNDKLKTTSVTFENSNYIIIALIVLSCVLLLLFVLMFLRFKHKKNSNQELSDVNANLHKMLDEKSDYEATNSAVEILQLRNRIDSISSKLESIFQINTQFSSNIDLANNKNKELESLNSNKNRLFSDILRGINDPTAAIKSLVDLLRSYDFSAFELKDIVENIVDTTKKIIYMSEDIQRLIEFETKEVKLNLDTVSVKEVINEAVAMDISDAKQKKMVITINIPTEITNFVFDAQKITVVLHNLLSNAIKYTHDGGKIYISTYMKDHSLVFEVKDTGTGVDEEELITSINSNLSAKNNLAITGKIGLLTVKKYVEAHNGKLWVSSVINKGSNFSFSIPETR